MDETREPQPGITADSFFFLVALVAGGVILIALIRSGYWDQSFVTKAAYGAGFLGAVLAIFRRVQLGEFHRQLKNRGGFWPTYVEEVSAESGSAFEATQEHSLRRLGTRALPPERVATLLGSRLATVGVIGTMAFLVTSLGGLEELLATPRAVEHAAGDARFAKFFGGLTVAFNSSIGAFASSIWVIALDQFNRASARRLIDDVEQTTEREVFPAVVCTSDRQLASMQRVSLDLDDLRGAITKGLRGVQGAVSAGADKQQKALDRLNEVVWNRDRRLHLGEATRNAVVEVVELWRSIAGQLDGLARVPDELRELREAMGRLTEVVVNQQSQLRAISEIDSLLKELVVDSAKPLPPARATNAQVNGNGSSPKTTPNGVSKRSTK